MMARRASESSGLSCEDEINGCNVRTKAQIMASDVSRCDLAIRSVAIREAKSTREEVSATTATQHKTVEGIRFDTGIACEGSESSESQSETKHPIPQNCTIVYFDLETSGFHRYADILQIAAKFQNSTFCSYVKPTQPVNARASEVTGLTNVGGELHRHGEKVDSVPIKDALVAFHEFLKLSEKRCLLVAHNAKFDAARLVHAVNSNSMIDKFQTVVLGFSDTLALFKEIYSERKGAGMFKLSKLAQDFLNIEDDNESFHDALYDVEILEKLCRPVMLQIPSFFETCERFIDTVNQYKQKQKDAEALTRLAPLRKVVTEEMLKRIARAAITYNRLEEVLKTCGKQGVIDLLSERKIDKKPLVTNNKRILLAITDFLAENMGRFTTEYDNQYRANYNFLLNC